MSVNERAFLQSFIGSRHYAMPINYPSDTSRVSTPQGWKQGCETIGSHLKLFKSRLGRKEVERHTRT